MSITLVVFAGFYTAARHTVRYADMLAQALRGQLVLLHIDRVALFDTYALMGEGYRHEALSREADTATALQRLSEELPTHPTVEVATDLLPNIAEDLFERHRPALFVLSQPDTDQPSVVSVALACADLLRAGQYPLLVVPLKTPISQAPRRIMIAVDREPFELATDSRELCQLLALPGADVFVAHISSGLDDDAGCAEALRAVQASGLVKKSAPTPELRGYEYDDYAEGLLAAVQDIEADLVVVLARQRSYLGEVFHRSVTARLLERCPVPVLVLPTAPEIPAGLVSTTTASAAQWTNGLLAGLAPAS